MAAYSAGEGGVGVFAYTRVRLFDNSMSRVGAHSRKSLSDAVQYSNHATVSITKGKLLNISRR